MNHLGHCCKAYYIHEEDCNLEGGKVGIKQGGKLYLEGWGIFHIEHSKRVNLQTQQIVMGYCSHPRVALQSDRNFQERHSFHHELRGTRLHA